MSGKAKQGGTVAPGEGERRAQRGFQEQYAVSGALIYASLLRNELDWLGLADRRTGILDDLVLGLRGKVVGHQIKSAQFPTAFTLRTLMLGADKTLEGLVSAWQALCQQFPREDVEVRFVTTHFPSINDDLVGGGAGSNHSASFIADFREHPNRSLADWRSSRWTPLVEELRQASELDDANFERFIRALRIVCGHDASLLKGAQGEQMERGVRDIMRVLPELVAHKSDRDRWSRQELLTKLKWSDAIGRRRSHQFPIGTFVQRNVATERRLLEAIGNAKKGYVALLGPPGSGKSTLLQAGFQPAADFVIVRYFAFLPDESHGLGRAEAEEFLLDVTSELRRGGLQGLRYHDADIHEMRQQFEHLLKQAGERFAQHGVTTVIVVDGLDHIPREENPARSLLCELPLPASVPKGVVFVLGSQRLDLPGLAGAVRDEAGALSRCINIDPLSREAISNFADQAGLDAKIDREAIYKLTQGHPLAARYLVEALKAAPTERVRDELLSEKFDYQGDILRVYDAAWRDVEGDADVRHVLAYVARAEGPIDPDLIIGLVNREAVERTYGATRHLLEIHNGRWRAFHNSFRLYLLGKEEQPLGKKDRDYSKRLYSDLASLTTKAGECDPQRWLELRYRAKAGENSHVIALATPERFRTQLAEGRPAHDIQTDIRLVFQSIIGTQDLTQLIGLLLSRHEIMRRAETLRYADNIADAYLALGDLDAARGLIEEGISSSKAYEILDAFVETGRIDDARRMFDSIEPISNSRGYQLSQAELEPWAERVHQFRQPDQVRVAVARLSMPTGDTEYQKLEAEQTREWLRFEIARAAISATPAVDVDQVAKELEVPESDWPYLRLTAAWSAYADNQPSVAAAHLTRVIDSLSVTPLQLGWCRSAAVLALRLGDTASSKRIFAELEAPSIADGEDSIGSQSMQSLALAIVEHAALATALDEPAPMFKSSKYQVLTTFQSHLATLGALLGTAGRGDKSSALGLIRSCEICLAFLSNISPDGAETAYRVSLVRSASTAIIKEMIRAGVLYNQGTYSAILSTIDDVTTAKTGNLRASALRQEIATTVFDYDHDADAAAVRLDAAFAEMTDADTPAEQVNEIAGFARAFAHIGNELRAREILATIPRETLGYSLPPKKDPQYIFWRSVFEHACRAEPATRRAKVCFMVRLLIGMGRTEGRSTAYRLAASVVEQAAMAGPGIGAAVADVFEEHSLIPWDSLIDGLLRGIMARRADLVLVAAHAWVRLVLPFYEEAYYHESRLGGFIGQALGHSPANQVQVLVDLFTTSIEAESVQGIRPALLEVLLNAARSKGASVTALEQALERWRRETPPKSDSSGGSPDPFVDVTSLLELSERLKKLVGEPDYRTVDHVNRLIEVSSLADAENFLTAHPKFLDDSRIRFTLATAAVTAKRPDRARELLGQYKPERDSRAFWDPWYGGAKLEYHRVKVMLDGAPARKVAFSQLAEDLAHFIRRGRALSWIGGDEAVGLA